MTVLAYARDQLHGWCVACRDAGRQVSALDVGLRVVHKGDQAVAVADAVLGGRCPVVLCGGRCRGWVS
jgi:hypothetical protein